MAFQPFGFRFDIRAPMRRDEAKTAIRRRLKRWLDPVHGARGWIIGPFLCLWSSMLDRNGPMVLGRIVDDGFATRIRGRAGSDLNGTIWLVFLTAVIAGLFALDGSVRDLVVPAGIFVVFVPLVLWLSHSDRHEADHLVRFLEDVVTPTAKSRRTDAASLRISDRFALDASGARSVRPVTGAALYDALLGLGIGDYVVLSSAPEVYIQALAEESGTIIEKREGGPSGHFRGVRSATPLPDGGDAQHFSFDEAWAVFAAYASEAPIPAVLVWHPMDLPE